MRARVPGVTGQPGYDPTKNQGLAQQAPLKPEFQAILEANLKEQATGGQGGDPTYVCISPGMPRIMNPYGDMEIVITPDTTHILLEHIHDSRRIFTDGRAWPTDYIEPTLPGLFDRQVARHRRRRPLRHARGRDAQLQGSARLRCRRHSVASRQRDRGEGTHSLGQEQAGHA